MQRHLGLLCLAVAVTAATACSVFGGDDKETPPAGTIEENEPGGRATERSGPEAFILNEIRISGDAQFVELKNAGSGPASPLGLMLVGAELTIALAMGPLSAEPGGVVLISFDGAGPARGQRHPPGQIETVLG